MFQGAVINDSGLVAFNGDLAGGGQGVFLGDGPSIQPVLTDSSTFPFGNFGEPPGINASGAVSIRKVDEGILVVEGATTTVISTNRGSGPTPINDSGLVVFRGNGGQRIVAGDGSFVSSVAEVGGDIASLGSWVTLNNSGAIAFNAGMTSGEFSIMLSDESGTTTLVDTSGIFESVGGPMTINDQGFLAFGALTNDGDSAIWVHDGEALDRIVGVGDVLDGATITAINRNLHESFNDVGQLAFSVQLSDGTSAIYRATPIPEPSTGILVGLGLLWLRVRRHWNPTYPL